LHPFFPVHDLTHCAVESVFGFEEAFFGLVASGWHIDDFAEPGAAGRMPLEALWTENMVGLLDLERGTGEIMSAAQFNEVLTVALRGRRVEVFRPVREAELTCVRSLCAELRARWDAVPPGATLEVTFPVTTAEP
jgi:hypothetical protein